jgi:acyl-coenzyme A synthetase/AMP-(fatty) acid ligase
MPSRSFLTTLGEWTRIQPEAPALSFADRLVSYAELDRLVDAAAPALATLDADDPAPVCVPARKSPETIALVIACLAAGRRILLPSADLGAEALAALATEVGCGHVLTAAGVSRVAGTAGHPGPGPASSDPGLLLTTSGSTGLPKAVVLTADGVDRFLSWGAKQFEIGPGTAVLNYAPLNFDLCLLDVWATLAAGGCVELVEQDRAANGGYLLDLCTRRAPAVIQAVPMFYRLLADAAAGRRVFGSVRHAIFTGDTMPLALLRRLPGLFPHATQRNVYGCTETNDSFVHEVDVDAALALGEVPIGRPIVGVDSVIVDADGAAVVGPGSGELLVATPFQAAGYVDRQRTAEKWRDGYFRTGDQVRRDADGLFFLAGRNDYHVKVRGVRTNLAEVEQVILDHPGVVEAAVVAVPDELAGNILHAVVRRKAAGLNSIQLRKHCAENLPRTAVPGVVRIVDLPLPRTSTGKVDRNLLKTLGEGK